jgi:undecaprenyl-diphosphatase
MWAFLIAYSRIYLGVHYFGDVFVGALVGSLIGILIFKIFMLIINKLWQN